MLLDQLRYRQPYVTRGRERFEELTQSTIPTVVLDLKVWQLFLEA